MPSLFNRNQANSSTPPPAAPSAQPPAPAPAPPPPPTLPLSATLESAAKDFKKLFTDNGAAYALRGGQGALYREMRVKLLAKVSTMTSDALKSELTNLIEGTGFSQMRSDLFHSEVRLGLQTQKSLPDGDPDKTKLPGVLRTKSIVNTTRTYRQGTTAARQLMAEAAPADRTAASEILDDTTGTGQWSWDTTGNWMNQPKLAPVTFDKISLPRMLALSINASVQCAPIASSTARKCLTTRGVSPGAVAPFPAVTFQTKKSDKALRNQDVDPRSTDRNQILQYNATQLDTAMQGVRTVLTNGYLVAACLSGMIWDVGQHPFPEHFILLFAADADQLLFWDPDTSVTHITEFGDRLGINIGILYYDHSDAARPRLSTAVDYADLNALTGGDHTNHPARHRYQISGLSK